MLDVRPILLIEHDLRDAELTMSALARSRMTNEIVHVRDGATGLAYLRREGEYADSFTNPPGLVLVEVRLPHLDGLQVLDAIRADPTLCTLPVVMLTASSDERDVLKSYRHGANAYVVKPVDGPRMFDAIARLGMFWGVVNHPPPPIS